MRARQARHSLTIATRASATAKRGKSTSYSNATNRRVTVASETARMRFCCICGEELGVIEAGRYDRLDTCNSVECERELWHAEADDEAEREHRAREDRFGRY